MAKYERKYYTDPRPTASPAQRRPSPARKEQRREPEPDTQDPIRAEHERMRELLKKRYGNLRNSNEAIEHRVMQMSIARGIPTPEEYQRSTDAAGVVRDFARDLRPPGYEYLPGPAQVAYDSAARTGQQFVNAFEAQSSSTMTGGLVRAKRVIDAYREDGYFELDDITASTEGKKGEYYNAVAELDKQNDGLAAGAGGMAGYLADPVWLATYGAGRLLQAGRYAKMQPWKAEIVKDAVAGLGADVTATSIREADAGEVATETGFGVAGAVGLGLAGRGIGKAWRHFFPDEALPSNIDEAKRILDERRPGWSDIQPNAGDVRRIERLQGNREAALTDPTNDLAMGLNRANNQQLGADRTATWQQDVRDARENYRVLNSELEARKADAASDPSNDLAMGLNRAENARIGAEAKARAEDIIPDGMTREDIYGADDGTRRFLRRAEATERLNNPRPSGVDPPRPETQFDVDAQTAARSVSDTEVDDALRKQEIQEVLGDDGVAAEIDMWIKDGKTPAEAEQIALTGILDDLPQSRSVEGSPSGVASAKTRGTTTILPDIVNAGLKSGQWAGKHSIASAKWALATAGDAIRSMRDLAQILMRQFGRGIRKHVPRIWDQFKATVAKRNAIRQRTMSLRTKGGVDPREGLPKSKVKRIEQRARGELRKQMSGERKVRKAFRRRAEQIIRDVFEGSDVAKKYLRRVSDATTETRVSKVLAEAVEHAEAIRVRRAADKAGVEITKMLRTQVGDGGVKFEAAFRNKDFTNQVAKIGAMGINNPARPTKGEMRAIAKDGRLGEVMDEYVKMRNEFAEVRQEFAFVKDVKKKADKVARDVKLNKPKEIKGKPGVDAPPNPGVIARTVRNGWLNTETMTGLLGKSARAFIYEPIRLARKRQLNRLREWTEGLIADLNKAGVIADASPRGLRKWIRSTSGKSAPRVDIQLESGVTMSLTKAQRWELLAHLGDEETIELIAKGAPIRLRSEARSIKLSEGDLLNILGSMNDEDGAVVRVFRGVFNTKPNSMKKAINTFKRETEGVDDFAKSDSYFPRTRDHEFALSEFDNLDELLVKTKPGNIDSRPIMKGRTQDLDSPIIIGDIFSTFDRHAAQVSAIVEMSTAIRDVHGILSRGNVRDSIASRYGDDMVKSMSTWLEDVAQDAARYGSRGRSEDTFLRKLVHNIGIGTLGANPWTIAKQIPSLLGASLEIEPRFLAMGAREAANPLSEVGKAVRQRMRQHNSNIWARYEMHTSRLVGDMTNDPAMVTRAREPMEAAMLGIAKADEAVIASIWRGAELKMSGKFKYGTDAFWDAVSEEADRVIRRTQPNFDMVNASSMQRAGKTNAFNKAVSMFMSQRNVYFNLMYDAIASGDKRKMAKVIGLIAVVNPLMIAAIDETRDWAYGRNQGHDTGDLAMDFGVNAVSNNLSYAYFGDLGSYIFKSAVEDRPFEPSSPIVGNIEGYGRAVGYARNGEWGKAGERAALSTSALAGVPLQAPWRIGEVLIEAMENIDVPVGFESTPQPTQQPPPRLAPPPPRRLAPPPPRRPAPPRPR